MTDAWKFVPVEPADRMVIAADMATDADDIDLTEEEIRAAWGAMVSSAPPPWHSIEQGPAGVGELLLFIPDLGWRPAEYDGEGNWRSPIDDTTYTDGTHWMYCLPRPDET